MPNWYDRSKRQEQSKSRYTASIQADIWVPQEMDKEQERENARNVLDSVLPSDGTSSSFTDSNIKFNIWEVQPYAELV